MNTNQRIPLGLALIMAMLSKADAGDPDIGCTCQFCTAERLKREAESAAAAGAEPQKLDELKARGMAAGFGDALEALRAGYGVRRSGWNGKGLTVRMQVPDANSKMTLPYLYIEYPADAANTPGARCPWLASQTDILAMDWEIA